MKISSIVFFLSVAIGGFLVAPSSATKGSLRAEPEGRSKLPVVEQEHRLNVEH
jgi:hypothetical protein